MYNDRNEKNQWQAINTGKRNCLLFSNSNGKLHNKSPYDKTDTLTPSGQQKTRTLCFETNVINLLKSNKVFCGF